jgi:hypothetical protein
MKVKPPLGLFLPVYMNSPEAVSNISSPFIIYKTYIGEAHYKPWLDFSQHAIITCHHPLCAMSSSTKSHIYVLNRFSVAYSMYITPQNSCGQF